MKLKLLWLLVTSCALSFAAKSQIYADSVISSTFTSNPQNAVSTNDSDYATMSTTLGIGNTSTLRLGFNPFGFGGMNCAFKLQSVNGGVISTSVLQNLDLLLYNKDGSVVTEKDGFTTSDAHLLDGSTNTYSINVRVKNSAGKVTSAELRLHSTLTLVNELRIFQASLRFVCPGITANTVTSFSNVTNPNNAVDNNDDNYALLLPPALGGYANLAASFGNGDKATGAIRFTFGQATATISAGLISNLTLTAYDGDGNVIAAKNDYTLADVQISSNGKFSLSVPLPTGSLVASGSVRLQSILNLFTDLKLYSITINKTQLSKPKITPAGVSTICSGDSIKLVQKPNYSGQTITWQWYKNNNVIPGAVKQRYYASANGRYFVTITNQDNCENISDYVTVINTNCSVAQAMPVAKLNVYPNPFASYTTLSLSNIKTSGAITVSDKSGNIVQKVNIQGSESVKLLVNASPGVYFIKLVTKEGDVYSTKVLKL